MKKSKITVLMPVYNAEKFLKEAIESILNQTFKDFEFIIIADPSTDHSKEIILSYKDPRIIYIENNKKLGLVKTLNKGLNLAKGDYIARMDADDISLPKRLEKQVEFMEKNPQVAVCGTWIKLFGNNKNDVWKVPGDFETIRCLMLFYSVIYHPTVMIRSEILKKFHLYYDESFIHAEDYEFWVRIMENFKISNLNAVLLYRRIHQKSKGNINNKIVVEYANKVRLYQLNKLGIHPTSEEFKIHQAISYWEFKPDKKSVSAARLWLRKLFIANLKTNYYPQLAFFKVLAGKWLLI